MKLKGFIITFGSFAFTTFLLYFLGYIFTIPWFMFHYEYTHDAGEFFISIGSSLVPIIIGLVVSYMAEKMFIYKERKKWLD
ncbi:hypothetical protein [Neobacillus thermocopriae]|uniref:Uncharacterized protein n=1 Tax=Neobacillus thermocopriae TaxID=1215031 RepID=A0A6B3TPA1_9BACI|nr:hypothetical protein [Neobacillus thermocopriae]MED3624059.1 hypothetical protein [Neobacillus thermocopriae]MED3713746.1 hypothetical protein [Neobacillus thermocopriae]NEX78110.1 hypothetical protein [Neobacillus thermocopriae]